MNKKKFNSIFYTMYDNLTDMEIDILVLRFIMTKDLNDLFMHKIFVESRFYFLNQENNIKLGMINLFGE